MIEQQDYTPAGLLSSPLERSVRFLRTTGAEEPSFVHRPRAWTRPWRAEERFLVPTLRVHVLGKDHRKHEMRREGDLDLHTSILSPLTSDRPRRRRERSELSTMFFLGSYQQPTTSNLQQFSRAHAPRKQGLYQERESVPSPVKVSPLPVLLARLQRVENFRSHEYTICRNLKKEKAFYF